MISSISRSFACSGAHSKSVGSVWGVEEPQVRNRRTVVDIWIAVGCFDYTRVERTFFHVDVQDTHDDGSVCNEHDEAPGATNSVCHHLCFHVYYHPVSEVAWYM